jgi:hypothetical protein
MNLAITLIGGPTALIEIDGVRIVTDPTFDAPGAYQLPHVKLEKLSGPALSADSIGEVDAVLLSHDQHADRSFGQGFPGPGRAASSPRQQARGGSATMPRVLRPGRAPNSRARTARH